MQGLFRAIRTECSAQLWSRGVELVRACAVLAAAAGDGQDGEILLRVEAQGRAVPFNVTLYPEDEEWDCDCGGVTPVCEHVAAAVIALRRAREKGEALPSGAARVAQLSYRFTRQPERLVLERWLFSPDGQEQRLETNLSSLIADRDRADGLRIAPSQADLSIDRLLQVRRLSALPLDAVAPLLPLLAEATEVQLDGQIIKADPEPVLPRASVDENKGVVLLRVESDPSVVEVVLGGLVLCAPPVEGSSAASRSVEQPLTLRPLGEMELTGMRLERLPRERKFRGDEVGELVTEVLPSLTARIAVDIRAQSLPDRTRRMAPRTVVEVQQHGESLSVLPLLVYGDPPQARVDGERIIQLGRAIIERDERAERREGARLLQLLDLVHGRRVQHSGAAAHELALRLQQWGGQVQGSAHRDCYPSAALAAELNTRDGHFGLSFVARTSRSDGDGGGEPAEPELVRADAEAVIRAWRQGESLVALDGGGWAPIPQDWLERHGHRIADLLAARGESGALPPAAQPALLRLCDDLDHPRPARLESLACLVDGFEAIPGAVLPADLSATLRDYQRAGVDWLRFLQQAELGAVLADDMGLGKTLQVLCALQGRALVVCPTSVVHNWADEIRRFRPELRCSLYRGPRRKLDPDADVTLTSYALLRLDVEELSQIEWGTVVLDEAQAIKNPQSQVAQAAYSLPGAHRVAMSGTPVENRLEELWSLAHFTNPGVLGGRDDFRDRIARPIADGQPGAAERLRQRIRPFLLRRTKREVALELPPRTEAVMHCELEEAQREVYETVRLATKREVVQKLKAGGNVLAALEALLRLRQAACHAALVPGQRAERSAKIERLLAALDELVAGGHKALVFSQWTSFLDLVEPHLESAELGFTRLDGSTRDRAGVVRGFQDPDGPPVMLLSLKAGGTGLNLTAADHVFLLDPWWNPAVEEQAADRAHRIGQDRPVMVHRLVAKDTVEERILALQERKRALADAALAGADQAGGLTRQDLLALLE